MKRRDGAAQLQARMKAPRRIVVLDDDARGASAHPVGAAPAGVRGVRAFADGRDALMRLHEIEPALILSDVWMPDLDGPALPAGRESARRRCARCRSLFLTAVSGDTAVDAALQAGADGFLMSVPGHAAAREGAHAAGDAARRARPRGGARQHPAPPPFERAPVPHAEPAARAPEPSAAPARRRSRRVRPSGPHDGWEADFTGAGNGKDLSAEIEGRFTMAQVGGRKIPVLTEAANRPSFTITTQMTFNGRAIRKIETTWQHPLERREDVATAHQESASSTSRRWPRSRRWARRWRRAASCSIRGTGWWTAASSAGRSAPSWPRRRAASARSRRSTCCT